MNDTSSSCRRVWRLHKWVILYGLPKKAVRLSQENGMNTNDLYISSISVAQTYYDWYHEARAFYKECGGEMPKDWWDRWVRVLGLRLVDYRRGL